MATSAADLKERLRFHDADSRVMLHEVPWKDYERLLEIRGDSAGPSPMNVTSWETENPAFQISSSK